MNLNISLLKLSNINVCKKKPFSHILILGCLHQFKGINYGYQGYKINLKRYLRRRSEGLLYINRQLGELWPIREKNK